MSWNPKGCPCKSHHVLRIQAGLIKSMGHVEEAYADPYELVVHFRLPSIHEFKVELSLEI